MTSKFLTPKQKQVLEFIQAHQAEKGYAPSQKEIAAKFGFSSLGTVQHYLNQLGELGFLKKEWNARRGLSVAPENAKPTAPAPALSEEPNIRSLPLLGKVAAGRPIEAVQSPEFLDVPMSLLKKSGEHFILKVQGDSMIGDGILDGDYVIIRKQDSAENGETVVALIDNEATIKRYQRKGGQVELHAANPAYPTIHVDPERRFRIEGILAGLIRRWS
ncbi:MAG: transcriptional repressor LexA [Bdellovibrionia bacterium]